MSESTIFTDPRITVTTVFVVESLRPGDPRTGEALYDDVLRPIGFPDNPLEPELRQVKDAEGFWAALQDVEAYARAGGSPILHIEAHGSQTGVELGNGQHIPWSEVVPLFRRVNEMTALNFVVTAAACSGFRLGFEVMPFSGAPVRALIGPVKEIPGHVLRSAFGAFYTVLFETSNLSSAVGAMKSAAPPRSAELVVETAESLFALAFHGYLRDHASPRRMAERKREIVRLALRGVPVGKRNSVRKAVDREIARRTPEQYFGEMLGTFFMYDRVPDAKTRFSPDWGEFLRWREENRAYLPW